VLRTSVLRVLKHCVYKVNLSVSTVANNPIRFIELVSIAHIYELSPLSIIRLHASVFLCFSNKILQFAILIPIPPPYQSSSLTDWSFGFVKEFRRVEGWYEMRV
jgi:hypothetical protein